MDLFRQPRFSVSLLAGLALLAAGCASPGPPRPPSLHLPTPVADLVAARSGDSVDLRFTLPTHSTDKLSLPPAPITISICRELDHQACVQIPALSANGAPGASMDLRDDLPTGISSGTPSLLAYRVELLNASGRSAGKCDAAFTASGPAPPPVEGLRAEGSRLGVILRWNAISAEDEQVSFRREDLSPKNKEKTQESRERTSSPQRTAGSARQAGMHTPRKSSDREPNVIWLVAGADEAAGANHDGRTLDTSALAGGWYRYTAVRRRSVRLGGRSIEMRSADSTSVDFVLREIYPPAAPTGLVAAGFTTATNAAGEGKFAVDLIWQPVDDPDVAGYNIYRQAIDAMGSPVGKREQLNLSAVPLPGFHDATASAAARYLYGVTAVDHEGNESQAVSAMLEPQATP